MGILSGGISLGIRLGGLISSSPKASSAGASFWELAGAGNLKPDEKGKVSDYDGCWDLSSDDDYMPELRPVSDGFWVAVVNDDEGTYEIKPKNV